jgi:hypothetical protein
MKQLVILLLALLFFTSTHTLVRGAHPLEQWGLRTAPGTGYGLNAIAFGNEAFVAVGTAGTILCSTDGVNWTNTAPANYGQLRTVRFLNGQFLVVGNTNVMLLSSNGVNWSTATLPSNKNYWDIAYGNSRYVVAGDNAFVSLDLTNWLATDPRVLIFPSPPDYRVVKIDTLTFGNGEFVATTFNPYVGKPGVFHSAYGTNWIGSSGPYSASPQFPCEMSYANGLFLLAHVTEHQVYSSSNGSNWFAVSSYPFGSALTPRGVAYGSGYFVTVGSEATGPGGFSFFSSSNAVNWDRRFPASSQPLFTPQGVAFGKGTFVAVGAGDTGPIIYQSGNLSGAPTIVTEPLDRAAVVNNPASFSVAATGSDPLAYQWHKDGNPILGGTNSSFTITNVAVTNSGGYYVVVTNSFGSVTSRVAQLTVSFLQIHEYAGITILGVPGKTYQIEAAPQAGGSWSVLTNIVLPQTPFIWIDYDSPNVATRVYRAAEF